MQANLLPFIDWSCYPRQIFAPGDRIITAGDPTNILFLLEQGLALAPNAAFPKQPQPEDIKKIACGIDITFKEGAFLSLLEMLSLETYRHDVLAHEECCVVGINRTEIKTMWDRDSHLAWPLSRSIATTITQHRQTRFLI